MARCPECGRKLDAFNSIRFSERECLGVDASGKKEYTTTSFTVCAVCAAYIESAIARGRVQAHDSARRRDVSRS